MGMLSCGTELCSFVLIGAPTFTTTASKRDGNYSRGAVRCWGSAAVELRPFAATNEGWWRGTSVGNTGTYGGWNGTSVKFFDGAGNWPYALTINGGVWYLAVYNGSGYTQVSSGVGHGTSLVHMCVHWKRDAADGRVELFINDALVATISGNTTLGSSGGVTTVRHGNIGNGSTASNEDINWSECVASTDYLIGRRLCTLYVAGAGAVNTFDAGGATEVDETGIDAGDIATSGTAGQELELALADPYAGLVGAIPNSVALHAWAQRGASGPTSLALGFNTNAAVHYGPDVALDPTFGAVQRIADVNPVTGLPWTMAEAAALAARLKSAA